jgi:hypothetical protein
MKLMKKLIFIAGASLLMTSGTCVLARDAAAVLHTMIMQGRPLNMLSPYITSKSVNQYEEIVVMPLGRPLGVVQTMELKPLLDTEVTLMATPLHLAILYNRPEVVNALLEKGANPLQKIYDTRKEFSKNALELAEYIGQGRRAEIIDSIRASMARKKFTQPMRTFTSR